MKKRIKSEGNKKNPISALNKWIRELKQGDFKYDEQHIQNLQKKLFKKGAENEYVAEFNTKKFIIEKNLKNLEKEIGDKTKEGLQLEPPKFSIKNRFVLDKDPQKKYV